ncbi:hypothetical protein PNOK_0919600 [Pyrrhoderma noxium]|uniref:Uncharacterized protein n=1 Tax=Pyrrhoderma noxium TaxID=2282107 RepID=A0A286U793_9AGAM|nr:hypothetical protein PNOK_0919600 [Pyrrhoderma noxium]
MNFIIKFLNTVEYLHFQNFKAQDSVTRTLSKIKKEDHVARSQLGNKLGVYTLMGNRCRNFTYDRSCLALPFYRPKIGDSSRPPHRLEDYTGISSPGDNKIYRDVQMMFL